MLEQLFITFQILIIDVVMAADNAIIIGLIAANFAPDNRRKIIAWGVAAAFIFRIFFATGANYIFEFAWVKILGGVLLIWVINNLRQDFFGQNKVGRKLLFLVYCLFSAFLFAPRRVPDGVGLGSWGIPTPPAGSLFYTFRGQLRIVYICFMFLTKV